MCAFYGCNVQMQCHFQFKFDLQYLDLFTISKTISIHYMKAYHTNIVRKADTGLKDHLPLKTTFDVSQGWSLNPGLTVSIDIETTRKEKWNVDMETQ